MLNVASGHIFYTRIAIKYSNEEIASKDQKCIFNLLLDAFSFNRMSQCDNIYYVDLKVCEIEKN